MNAPCKEHHSIHKQILIAILCVITCIGLLPLNANAEPAHTHSDACYAQAGDTLCTLPEEAEHTHTDDCFCPGGELTCAMDESDEHSHNEACYCPGGEAICDQEEAEGHTHDDDCYAQGGELVCGQGKEFDVMPLSDPSTVSDFAALQDAVNNADGAETHITLAGDIEFTDTLVIPAGKNIVIEAPAGGSSTCTSTAALARKSMIKVDEGATFTLDGNVTLDGSSAQGYVLCNGAFTMKDGTLTGCDIKTSDRSLGGVTVSGENAIFTMDGGTIQNTTSSNALQGAVYVCKKAKFVMNNGSVNDNRFDNQFCAAIVIDDASFEMNGGEISNNKTDVSQISSGGGVLVMGLGWGQVTRDDNAKSSSFVMNGGKISGNESNRGGGVYVMGGSVNHTDFYSKAYFTMNGGEITGNKTTNYTQGNTNIVSAGAGIYVEWAGEVTMNGGSISNNSTQGMGGGVATSDAWTNYFGKNSFESAGNRQYNGLYYRDWPNIFPAAFTMNGGEITGNQAMNTSVVGDQGCGGGIYVASDNVTLNAGDISNNQSGKQGGGVYVGSVPYVLTMKDALITNNSASVIGGGIWLCPTGIVDASVNNGSAIFGNTAGGAADDFAAVHTISDFTASISTHMLGGGLANWYHDGAIDDTYILGTADTSVPRYVEGGNNTPVTETSALTGCISMKSAPTSEAQEAAKALAQLTITNNKSARGGGVGSNGDVEIGDTFDITRDLTVNKQWVGSDNVPDSVFAWVIIDGHKTQRIELTKVENWTTTVTDLPISGDITIEEETIDGWKPSYQYNTEANGNVTATITNEHEPEEPGEPDEPKESEEDEGDGGNKTAKTGDDMTALGFAGLGGAAIFALGAALIARRKTN